MCWVSRGYDENITSPKTTPCRYHRSVSRSVSRTPAREKVASQTTRACSVSGSHAGKAHDGESQSGARHGLAWKTPCVSVACGPRDDILSTVKSRPAWFTSADWIISSTLDIASVVVSAGEDHRLQRKTA